jgi:hypothetical protein
MIRSSRASLSILPLLAVLLAGVLARPQPGAAAGRGDTHATRMFTGVKANTGTAMHSVVDGRDVLTLSDDFIVPDSPAPHWQVVDSRGNAYLLNRLKIKDDKYNKSITLPRYIPDVARVQIWCSWAEVLLGEAPFDSTIRLKQAGR